MNVIVGTSGFVGSNLLRVAKAMGKDVASFARHEFDIVKDNLKFFPKVLYLMAGCNGFQKCEGNHMAYRTNVDGTIRMAKKAAHMVWLSSDSVEWADTAYARQKQLAEIGLQSIGNTSIIRCARITKDNIDDLCRVILERGEEQRPGLYLWGLG